MPRPVASQSDSWPDLPLAAWSETYATLHLFTQIVGKVRLARSPWVNHSWHVTLYVTARGLTTSPIPYGARTFQIEFDFVDHQLRLLSSDGATGGFPLQPQSVAAFYARLMEEMGKLGLQVSISRKPNEVAEPSASTRMRYTRPTIANTSTGSGGSSFNRTASSKRFERDSSASPAPCISSGGRPTSQSRGFPDEARHNIRAEFHTCRTG